VSSRRGTNNNRRGTFAPSCRGSKENWELGRQKRSTDRADLPARACRPAKFKKAHSSSGNEMKMAKADVTEREISTKSSDGVNKKKPKGAKG